MYHIIKTQTTYEGEYNKNDRNIGLFDLKQIIIIKDALDKDIITINKWNK